MLSLISFLKLTSSSPLFFNLADMVSGDTFYRLTKATQKWSTYVWSWRLPKSECQCSNCSNWLVTTDQCPLSFGLVTSVLYLVISVHNSVGRPICRLLALGFCPSVPGVSNLDICAKHAHAWFKCMERDSNTKYMMLCASCRSCSSRCELVYCLAMYCATKCISSVKNCS